jgi:hypothetical protein
MASADPIERSFELAAERCEDLTPLVYRKLFGEHPEAEKMFRSEGSGPVKGSMLALTIEAILDFAGERRGHFRLIECEVSSHDAYGTPRELFVAFFGVIAATLREIVARTGRWRSMRRGASCWPKSRASSGASHESKISDMICLAGGTRCRLASSSAQSSSV